MKVFILSAYEESQYNFAFQNLKKASIYDQFKFYYVSDAAAILHSYRKGITFFDYLGQYVRFFESFNFRNILRHYKNKYVNIIKKHI